MDAGRKSRIEAGSEVTASPEVFNSLRGSWHFCCAAVLSVGLLACTSGDGDTSSASGNLVVSPRTPWLVATVEGQMPEEASRDHTLTNSTSEPLDWLALSTQPWLTVSSPGGQLAGGASTSVTVSLDAGAVTAFAPGSYDAELEFQDNSMAPAYIVVVPVTLTVIAAQYSITVTPPESFTSSGSQGGPFSPGSKSYTIENTGSVPFDWNLTTSESWVELPFPASGSLGPGSSVQVELRIHQTTAAGLSVGTHTAQVLFEDANSGVPVAVRDVVLQVHDLGGWTTFTPSSDTRIIYVSSSQGNDANDGLSEATPKRTIAAGMSLLRNGFPDWLLLKKGDEWHLSGWLGWPPVSGKNGSEKLLFSSYGSGPRPRILFPDSSSGLGLTDRSYIAIVDISLEIPPPYTGLGGAGFSAYGCSDILFEGCYLTGFGNCVELNGTSNLTMRRCVVYYAHNTSVIAATPLNCLFEENIIYNTGEILKLQGSGISPHGFYMSCAPGATSYTIRNNIISDTGYSALDMRPDNGVCDNNLIVRAPVGMDVGGGPCWTNFPDRTISITNNVILDGMHPFNQSGGAYAMQISQGSGQLVENNIICNATMKPWKGIRFNTEAGQHCKTLTLSHNIIYRWDGDGVSIEASESSLDNLILNSNDFQSLSDNALVNFLHGGIASKTSSSSNRFYSALAASNYWFLIEGTGKSLAEFKGVVGDTTSVGSPVQYKNPQAATIAGYHASLGQTASHQAFMAEAVQQSKGNWREEYTANAVNTWVRSCLIE